MKLDELRDLIKKHKRSELEFIIAELYKAISKSQKEDLNIDELIAKPIRETLSKSKTGKTKIRAFEDIEAETLAFIGNAKAGNYLSPNREVSKNERAKWRFVVKRLFKEITASAEVNSNQAPAANLLASLYETLCYSFEYTLFTAYDTFESVGIAQTDFFKQVLTLYNNYQDKAFFVEKGINLIICNALNRYTLYGSLIEIYIDFLNTSDLKYLAIEKARIQWKIVKDEPVQKQKWGFDSSEYWKKRKLENLNIIIFMCYAHLYEFQNAIDNFEQQHYESDPEVKLYILISLLFEYNQHNLILEQLEKAEKKGIDLRKSLQDLKMYIIKNNELPDYI